MATPKDSRSLALVPLRTALIFVIAVVIACAVGGLTLWACHLVPQAILAGLAAGAMAVLPLDKIVGR